MKPLYKPELEYLVGKIKADLSSKQDKLTAGDNITITNDTISATDTVYDDTAVQAELGKKADKTYVDNKVKTDVPAGAVFTDTKTTINGKTGAISKADIVALGIPAQDTDTITTINGKTGEIAKEDIVALGIPSQDTNTTYSEITTAEIDTGTASTLRTITARRLKYLLDKIVALFPSKTSELTNDSGFLTSVSKADVGLGNVDNTSDLNKPISTATQTALDGKAASSHTHTKSQITDFPASMTPTAHNQAGTTITIADSGGYFTGTNAETVLQEIGSTLDGLEAAITAITG